MEEKYMKAALVQAEKAFVMGDVPVGAVIVKDDQIIACAYNRKEETKDVTDHAEIIAIREACRCLNDWRLNGCTMYVTLEPCSMCMGAIEQARLDKVVFGTANIKDYKERTVDVVGNVLDNECSKIIKTFFQNQRIG